MPLCVRKRLHYCAVCVVQTYLSTRSGTWLLTRVGPGGLPVDYMGNTR
jgi:hypothetical protein